MKWLVVFLIISAAIATGIKSCSNALFVEGHPHSHIKPVSPESARRIGSFVSDYEPSVNKIEIHGKEYNINRAWVEYRTKLSYFLVWFPCYPRTKGVHVTIQFEDVIGVDNQSFKNVPFWLGLKFGSYTYLTKNQFTGMSDGEPQAQYTFIVTDRSTKEEIGKIQLNRK